MDDEWSFSFSFPTLPKGKRVTAAEAEILLQSRLRDKQQEFEDAVWQLARFYSSTGHQEEAKRYISFLMELSNDPEKQASYWLALGQLMEQTRDYNSAVDYYKQAFSLEPTNTRTWYFINNNLGYSLIQLGMNEEAEPYCRAAIEIDLAKYNAYKNLGLSLEGQGKFVDASLSYLDSVRANSSDRRALEHLEALVDQHPELMDSVPALDDNLKKSREAVDLGVGFTESYSKKQMEAAEDLTHPPEDSSRRSTPGSD